MRLGEGSKCKIVGGEHEGKEGIVLEGRYTISTSEVKIGEEVFIIPQEYIEPR